MNKKGAELAIRKLVLIVIILLVLFIALLAFVPMFREKVLGWIRGLPEYKYEYDEEIDVSELSDEERAGLCSGDLFVGKIKGETERAGGTKSFIDIYYDEFGIKTLLYWSGNDRNAEIKVFIPGWFWGKKDVVVAEVKNRKISVKKEFLDKSEAYIALNNKIIKETDREWGLPGTEVFELLDNAYYRSGNLICRTELSQFQICEKAWQELKNKKFTLIFKGKCGVDKNNIINFREWGTCCLEVSNLFLKTGEKEQQWYWTPDNTNFCEEFSNYDFDLIFDTKTQFWKVKVWIPEKGEVLYFGGGDCSQPLGYYNCELGFEEGFEKYGGVYVRDDVTCKEVKEKVVKKGEFDKIKNLIKNNYFILKRENKPLIEPLCIDSDAKTNPIKLRFKGGFLGLSSGDVYFVWQAEKRKVLASEKINFILEEEDPLVYDAAEFEAELNSKGKDSEIFNHINDIWENNIILYILKAKDLIEFIDRVTLTFNNAEDVFYIFQGEQPWDDIRRNRPYYLESWHNPGYCLDKYRGKHDCKFYNSDKKEERICEIKDDGRICLVGKEEKCGETCFCEEDYEDGDELIISDLNIVKERWKIEKEFWEGKAYLYLNKEGN